MKELQKTHRLVSLIVGALFCPVRSRDEAGGVIFERRRESES